MTITNEKSAVIMIDLWTNLYGRLDPYAVTDWIENAGNIQTAILASYNNFAEQVGDTVWYNNRRKIFKGAIPNFDDYEKHEIHRKKIADEQSTLKEILEYVNPKKDQIGAHEIWELIYYLEIISPDIKNLILIGGCFYNCLKYRPLGYNTLSENLSSAKYNILIYEPFVISPSPREMRSFLERSTDWTKIEDFHLLNYHNQLQHPWKDSLQKHKVNSDFRG